MLSMLGGPSTTAPQTVATGQVRSSRVLLMVSTSIAIGSILGCGSSPHSSRPSERPGTFDDVFRSLPPVPRPPTEQDKRGNAHGQSPIDWPTDLKAFPSCNIATPSSNQRAGLGVIATTCTSKSTGQPGVFVSRIAALPGGITPSAGKLESGDQIIAINRCLVSRAADLAIAITGLAPDWGAELLVIRDGNRLPPVRIRAHPWVEMRPDLNRCLRETSDDAAKCRSLGLRPVAATPPSPECSGTRTRP